MKNEIPFDQLLEDMEVEPEREQANRAARRATASRDQGDQFEALVRAENAEAEARNEGGW